jgi:hypothetical protein
MDLRADGIRIALNFGLWLVLMAASCTAHRPTKSSTLAPRIHNAEVFGVKVNQFIEFQIAASGQKPMLYEAKGSLKGLKLNPKTGQISGQVAERGVFVITLTASNSVGSDQKIINFIVGESTELTPPMVCLVQHAADRVRFEASGLADWGWRPVVDSLEAPKGNTGQNIQNALSASTSGRVGQWLELGSIEVSNSSANAKRLEVQLSLWALKSAPLRLHSCPALSDTLHLQRLTNEFLVAIHQDAGTQPAERIYRQNGIEIWSKVLSDGRRAVGIFNTTNRMQRIDIDWTTLGISKYKKMRDVWHGANTSRFAKKWSRSMDGESVVLLWLEG